MLRNGSAPRMKIMCLFQTMQDGIVPSPLHIHRLIEIYERPVLMCLSLDKSTPLQHIPVIATEVGQVMPVKLCRTNLLFYAR